MEFLVRNKYIKVTVSLVNLIGDCGTKYVSSITMVENKHAALTKKEKALLLKIALKKAAGYRYSFDRSDEYRKFIFSYKSDSDSFTKKLADVLVCKRIKSKSAHGGKPFEYAIFTMSMKAIKLPKHIQVLS